MSDTISIDQAGRLVLPKEIRDRFQMKGGAQLEVYVVGDHVELLPVKDDSDVEVIDEDGLLVLSGGAETFDAAEAIQADREERDEHLAP